MTSTLTIYKIEGETEILVSPGETLLDAILRAELVFAAPCGGGATCGKCKIKHISGPLTPPSVEELKALSPEELSAGLRLACRTIPLGDGEFQILDDSRGAKIQTDHSGIDIPLNPPISVKVVSLTKPSLENQSDDLSRLLESLDSKAIPSLFFRRNLPEAIRNGDWKVGVFMEEDKPLMVFPADEIPTPFGIAMDIGTTTVVAYLINLETGKTKGVISDMNHQKGFGADVVSRIEYASRGVVELERIGKRILHQIEGMAKELFLKNQEDPRGLCRITLAGNTTMMHLIAGINPRAIAQAPYIPADTAMLKVSASEMGLNLISEPTVVLLPSLSGYVGADITAGIVAVGLGSTPDPALLVDLGTNGEIVLWTGKKLLACSTAAGPALEGARISCGLPGVAGAVNSVSLTEGTINLETIGELQPQGLCGSGIVDALAVMLETGIVDETGRMVDADEYPEGTPESLTNLVNSEGEEPIFQLAPLENPRLGLTQKDVREIQLAKGAIAAGIICLLSEGDVKIDQIKTVHLAGGFGAHLNKESACRLKLLPPELKDRIKAVGNSAGLGAIAATLSVETLTAMNELKKRVQYIELSGSAQFQEEFMMQMMF